MSRSGREALPNVREWSGGPPGCPGLVGRPNWMSVSGLEANAEVWEWSGGHPGCPAVIWKPSQMSGSDRESLPDGREAHPDVR